MLRQLSTDDRAAAVAMLTAAPALNLYLLGNLETQGFDEPFCEFWGDFSPEGALRGVINRYMSGWEIYGHAHADWRGLMQILATHPTPATRLQDNPGGVASVLPWLRGYRAEKVSVEQLMQLAPHDFRPQSSPDGVRVRRATRLDLPRLAVFYANAEHMRRTAAAVEQPLRHTRLFIAEDAADGSGAILSAALTNAETAELAMIGGVYTPPAQRGRGLSQAVCSALCRDLLAAGKMPVLYWETPAAGAVYQKLGFQMQGTWRSVWLQKEAE